MSLLGSIARGLSRRPQDFGQVTPDDPIRFMRYLPVPQLPGGLQLTMDMALQLSVVWACVDAIAKAISSCHWHVYRVKGARREFLPDDPLEYLLNVRPNPEMGALGFREALLFGALTWGNGYAEIVPDGAGRVAELWPLLPERMVPRRVPQNSVGPNGEPEFTLYYEFHQLDGGVRYLDADRVFHIRGPSVTGLMGENLVARAAKSIALFMAMERFGLDYFANNTILGGYLKYPNGKLDPKVKDKLEADWKERRTGQGKRFTVPLLENGLEFVQFETDAEKAQLLDSRKFQVEEICRWYGVPPHKVAHLERATFNNIEHLNLEFTQTALVPWARRLEQEADFKLFSSRGPQRATKIDLGWLSHGDAKSRFEAYQIGRRIGVWSANDIRAQEGQNDIGPEGDVRIVESNMTTIEGLQKQVEQIGKEKPPPAPTGEGDQKGEDGGATGDGESDGTSARTSRLVRDATVTIFASALDRYRRVLVNRRSDLERKAVAAHVAAENINAEKERLRPQLVDQCERGASIVAEAHGRDVSEMERERALMRAADLVDGGSEPVDAALWLFGELTQEAR